jgi:hypothetical protein
MVNSATVTQPRCLQLGDSLEEYLIDATNDAPLRQLMMSMSEAVRTIAFKVRTASCAGTACVNSFGDEQLAVDMLADKLLFEALRYSGACKYACSEEVPEAVDMGGSGFSVAFDPLDGSSIVDTNFTVGTIFGVWPGDKLTGISGRDQAAAGMGIYGPRTIFCMALKDAPGTHEFLLQVCPISGRCLNVTSWLAGMTDGVSHPKVWGRSYLQEAIGRLPGAVRMPVTQIQKQIVVVDGVNRWLQSTVVCRELKGFGAQLPLPSAYDRVIY